MTHKERTQAIRDFKTLHKAHAILHDPDRKRNVDKIAEEEWDFEQICTCNSQCNSPCGGECGCGKCRSNYLEFLGEDR